jgi:hypothetical protein
MLTLSAGPGFARYLPGLAIPRGFGALRAEGCPVESDPATGDLAVGNLVNRHVLCRRPGRPERDADGRAAMATA